MRSEWPIVRLGDHCIKIGSGATPKGGKEAYLEAGSYRLIRSQNVYNQGFAWQGLAFISEEQAQRLDGVAVEARDVLVNITGDSVARVCTAPMAALPARVNQHVAIVRPRDTSFDADFLRWFLCTPEQQEILLGLASAGATRNALTKAMLEGLQVPMPPVLIQRILAAPLVAIENRIDLLRQTNATFEAIAQALFKSWFVDFDPVRAKAEGREPEGMDAATAALFPSEFEDSAIGPIPKGWRVGSLVDVSDLNAHSWSARRMPEEVVYVDLAGLKANAFDSLQRMVSSEAPSRARRELRAGDTLVGTVRPGNRSFGFVASAEPGLTGSTGFAVLSPRNTAYAEFTYLAATRSTNIDRLAALADGGAYPAVRPELVATTEATIPRDAVMQRFSQIAGVLLLRRAANEEQSRSLAEVRDALLPRLISGKLRVPEVSVQSEESAA